MPIHAPKTGFLGIWPKNGDQYERDPQKGIPIARKHVV